jgi:hypothetical protein
MNKLTKVIINGALFFAVQTAALAASEVEKPVSDAEKITRLERIVENLQERVGQLEKLPKSTNAASAKEEKIDPKSGWKYRDSWLKLKAGMTSNQVESILGHPIRIDNMGSGYKKFFYWGELPTGAISGYLEMYEGKIYKIYLPEFHE